MNLYALTGLCFMPVVVLLSFFIFFVDTKRFYLYLISIALAMIAVIPASFIQYWAVKLPFFRADTFISLLLGSLLLNGFVEESVKCAFECLIPRKNVTFRLFFCCILLFGLILLFANSFYFVDDGALTFIIEFLDLRNVLYDDNADKRAQKHTCYQFFVHIFLLEVLTSKILWAIVRDDIRYAINARQMVTEYKKR